MSFYSNMSSKSHQSVYILLKVVVENALHNRSDRACLPGKNTLNKCLHYFNPDHSSLGE